MCIDALGYVACNGCRKLNGCSDLTSTAGIAKMLTMQGVQSIVMNTLPSSVITSPDDCIQFLQGLGQSKSVSEITQSLRDSAAGGLVVYGLTFHKASAK